MIRLTAFLVCLAGAVQAQEMTSAPGGLIRVLDKLTGVVADFDLARGQSQSLGRLTVLLDECRYPTEDPAAEAEAHLTVTDSLLTTTAFSGWMIASSPALSALDHPRYDVWVLACDYPRAEPAPEATSEGEGE
jgi:hypothetical protein